MAHLTSLSFLIANAQKYSYAVPQININNLEWIQAVLEAAQEAHSPVILGVSMGAKKYIGSYKLVRDMVLDLMDAHKITVPVCLHLDHGNYDAVQEAIAGGFNSVMFDGSKLPFAENLKLSQEISQKCQRYGLGLEIEVGAIGGYEDGHVNDGERADVAECITIAQNVPMTILAASIGNIHGIYPPGWKGLNFQLLNEIGIKTKMPLVLHGGSGIDDEQIREAIRLGIRKINVNTECQIAFTGAILDYLGKNHDLNDKNTYDPRNYLKVGMEGIKRVCIKKFQLFGSENRY